MLNTHILLTASMILCYCASAGNVALWQFDKSHRQVSQQADSVSGLIAKKIPDCNMLIVDDSDILTGHNDKAEGFASLIIEVDFMPLELSQSQLVRKTVGNTDIGYQLALKEDGTLTFSFSHAEGKSGKVTSRRKVEAGKWHKVIAVWDGRYRFYNIQLQVDGYISWGSAPFCVRLINTNSPLSIGGLYRAEGNYGQIFNGDISKVKISHDNPNVLNNKGKADFEEIRQTGGHLANQKGFIESRFIYENPPTPECHASTIAPLGGGKIAAAWFGGTHEGHTDVGIWFSKYDGKKWSKPVCVVKPFGRNETSHLSMFNPALFKHSNGTLMLFYKDGLLEDMEARLITSQDDGQTWSDIIYYPPGLHGPSKNKPIELANGDILCAASGADMELYSPQGDILQKMQTPNPDKFFGVIQGTLLVHPNGLQGIFRTMNEPNIVQTWSHDNGKTWAPLAKLALPSNNSGLDGVTLKDGRHLLIYNHAHTPHGKWGGPRSPLNIAVSEDGINWQAALVLEDEPGEYSYPAIIQADDGLVHVSYTWKRWRVKWAVLAPDKFELKPIADEKRPD